MGSSSAGSTGFSPVGSLASLRSLSSFLSVKVSVSVLLSGSSTAISGLVTLLVIQGVLEATGFTVAKGRLLSCPSSLCSPTSPAGKSLIRLLTGASSTGLVEGSRCACLEGTGIHMRNRGSLVEIAGRIILVCLAVALVFGLAVGSVLIRPLEEPSCF